MKRLLSMLAFLMLTGATLTAAEAVNVVVSIPQATPNPSINAVTLPDGKTIPAQITENGLTFVLPSASGDIAVSPVSLRYVKAPEQFRFEEEKGKHVDLLFGDQKVLRYMNTPRDASTKDTHELTFKPFHHVFDPVKGETLLSNGAGLAANKDLLFPHHRGLFFAFNRISYGKEKDVDTWHGRKNEFTLHEKMLSKETGEVLGRHKALLSWHGRDGGEFAREERDVRVYRVPGGTLIDWSTTLTTTLDKVRLDGDPQHAGFHFRANMEVAKNGKQNTYYLRPDGKGKIGETRNWDAKGKDSRAINLPWNAMSFVVGGQRYTLLRINHPDNPKETRGSERDYGRFGDYFEYDLTPSNPLKLKYRVWVQPGEMTQEQCEAMARGFVQPVKVSLK